MTNVTMMTEAAQHDGEAAVDLSTTGSIRLRPACANGFAGLSSKSLKENWMPPFAAHDMAGPRGASLVALAIATVTAAAS